MKIRKPWGFTLVELVIVMILLSIVSLYATSRYIGAGSFSALAIQDSVISVARQVQLNRMQSNTSTSSDSFVLSIDSDCFGSVKGCAHPEGRSDWVANSEVLFSAPVTQVSFDLLGNPLGLASGGINIMIVGEASQATVSICANGLISRSGCL